MTDTAMQPPSKPRDPPAGGFHEDAAAFKGNAEGLSPWIEGPCARDAGETPAGGLTPKQIDQVDAFNALYSRWLALRAVFAAGIEEEAEWEARHDEFEAVELKMLFTRVPLAWMVWRKWEVLELALNAENLADLAEPERAFRALAAIRADLMRLGFGG